MLMTHQLNLRLSYHFLAKLLINMLMKKILILMYMQYFMVLKYFEDVFILLIMIRCTIRS